MDIALGRKQIQKLAVDELAVVLYLRLLFNVPLCIFIGGGVALVVKWIFGDSLPGDIAGLSMLISAGLLFFGWAAWKLIVARQELKQRPREVLRHTPTFYLWAKATHVLAGLSLLRHLLDKWLPTLLTPLFERLGMMAWVSSCLMAGFYVVYFVLLLLVWQPPPFVTVRAFMLAVAAAMAPPANISQ